MNRRSIDLLPIFDVEEGLRFAAPVSSRKLVAEIEVPKRNGLLVLTVPSFKVRAATIFVSGKVGGCVYTDHKQDKQQATKDALSIMLQMCDHDDAHVSFHPRPLSMVSALSSMFLGHAVEGDLTLPAAAYVTRMQTQLASTDDSACIVISTANGGLRMMFIHEGVASGTFDVGEQHFEDDVQPLLTSLAAEPFANITVSVLSSEHCPTFALSDFAY